MGIMRRAAKAFGCEILAPEDSFAAQKSFKGLLDQENINLILDIGANVGQFVRSVRRTGYKERILSFEPQSSAHAKLVSLARTDPKWTIANRTALGDAPGVVAMHTAANSLSSSILPMLPSHSVAAPDSRYVGTETTQVNRLDDLVSLTAQDRVLLKIDVQGYEKRVLDGAPRILANCRALIVEMSLLPLYESQILAQQLWEFLDKAGFEVWSFEPEFRSPDSGRLLQMDGYFVRRR